MNMREIEALAKALAPVFSRMMDLAKSSLRDEFKQQIAERDQRISGLEKSLAERPSIDEIAQKAAALVPAPKNGDPGESADMDQLKSHLAELVAAIPAPQDGASVTLEEVRPIIDAAIKELRGAADEALAKPLDLAEKASEALFKALGELRQPEDGVSVSVEDVAPMVREEVAKAVADLPAPRNGESVTAEDVRPMLAEMVGAAVKGLPPAAPGKDADMEAIKLHLVELVKTIDLPAAPSVDEVAATFERRFSDLTLSWERQAHDTFEKAADRMPKPQDGRDALPLESFDIALGDDGRTVTVKMQAGDVVIEKSVKIAAVIDRDTYKHDGTYEKGDGVSYGGCFWIAKCDSPQGVPGSGETDWRCAVKRGRDGKDLRDSASKHDTSKGVSIK